MAISLLRQSSTMEVIAFLKQENLNELVDDFEGKKLAFFVTPNILLYLK